MSFVILNGQKIKVGDSVRFITDEDLYPVDTHVNKPVLNRVYTVRSFSKAGGFLLKEITNDEMNTNLGACEPGFAVWRFEKAILTVDEILEKITESGMDSLKENELETLKNF